MAMLSSFSDESCTHAVCDFLSESKALQVFLFVTLHALDQLRIHLFGVRLVEYVLRLTLLDIHEYVGAAAPLVAPPAEVLVDGRHSRRRVDDVVVETDPLAAGGRADEAVEVAAVKPTSVDDDRVEDVCAGALAERLEVERLGELETVVDLDIVHALHIKPDPFEMEAHHRWELEEAHALLGVLRAEVLGPELILAHEQILPCVVSQRRL
mmetsp:Transcript_41530/g.117907  ORF Transcript_41530/g.117907 Transcript_41530/m.117907 type:complete len:210 (+) Transcript_41530:690-1319(+)